VEGFESKRGKKGWGGKGIAEAGKKLNRRRKKEGV